MKFNLKKTSVIVAVAAALLLLVAAVAFSHGHMGRHQGPREGFRGGPGPRDGLGPMMHDLNLTEDQKTQIKKIADSFHQSDEALFDQMRALHTSEPDPLSGTFDEAAVRTAAEARAKIQIELEVSHAKMMSQIAGVLTPDQKTQLAAKRQQFERKGPPPPPDEQK